MKNVSIALLLVLTTTSSLWSTEHTRKVASGQWTGWIVDSTCRSRNANPQGKACALACVKKGATLLLYTAPDRPLFGLDDQKLAAEHLGVSGDQDGAYIKVRQIDAADPTAPPRP